MTTSSGRSLGPRRSRRFLVRLLVAVAALIAGVGWCLGAGAARAAAAPAPPRPSVVVVGVPGLSWSDVSAGRTPVLWQLVADGASGSLSIRSAANDTCPVDGWVMLGAGNRAEGPPGCARLVPRGAWSAIVARNQRLDFGAQPGALAAALSAAGQCVSATGPDAWLAAGPRVGSDPSCPVHLVGAADPAAADAAVSSAGHPSPNHVVIVVGLAQLRPGPLHQLVAVAAGGPFRAGQLVSQSTRQAPYLQVMDVAPTVLALRDVATPTSMDGLPFRATGPAPGGSSAGHTVQRLRALDQAASADRSALPWFLGWLIGAQVIGYLAAGALARRGSPLAPAVARFTAVSAIAAPGLSYLWQAVPWWGTAAPILTLVGGTLACAVAVGAALVMAARVALARPAATGTGARTGAMLAPALAAGCTALVIAVDLIRGSPWQLDAPFGYSPVVAGRFTGMGNVAYGLFAPAALLAAAGVAGALARRTATALVVAVGCAAVVIDGAPQFGSDFGGVPSLVLGFAVLLVVLTRAKIVWWRVVAVAVVACAAVATFALFDYSRPAADQTHLGRFVGQLLHGQASTVIRRKAVANWDLLTYNPVNATVPFFTAWLGWRVWRPAGRLAAAESAYPELRAGLLGVVTTSVVGFFLNDSGVAIPAMAFLVAIPYAIALMAVAPARSAATRPVAPQPKTPHVLP